jgi:hypothetical protein
MAVVLTLGLTTGPLCASGPGNITADQQSIQALELRASHAQPREQCFLYAELVQQMTELSLRQYAAGDVAKATEMLKRVQQLAQKIHISAADNDKRMKDAEILLRRTAFRLSDMLHASSFEDRPLVEQTLAQVNMADNKAMMQVFRK